MKKRFISLALVVLTLLTLISCASGKASADAMPSSPSDTNGYYDKDIYDAPLEDKVESAPSIDSTTSDKSTINTGGRKVIFSSSFTVQTKDFSDSIKALESLITKYGGYIQSSDVYTGGSKYNSRTAYYSIRVPAENYLSMIGEAESIGTVTNRSDNNRDITEEYYGIEARLTTLETKQERLLALLKEASYIDDIISLNNALEQTMYEIESLTGTLKKYDSLISYSTIEVNIREVAEVTEPTPVNASLGQRIKDAFTDSVTGVVIFFEELIVFLVGAVPVLIPIVIVAVIIIVSVRIKIKRKKAKDGEKINF